MRQRKLFKLLGVVLVLQVLAVAPSQALTVVPFDLEDLAILAEQCVRVRVIQVDTSDPDAIRYELAVKELIFGEPPGDRFELELTTQVPEMPRLQRGREYVLLLRLSNSIERVLGLQWGAFEVRGTEMVDYRGRPVVEQVMSSNPLPVAESVAGAEPRPRAVTYDWFARELRELERRIAPVKERRQARRAAASSRGGGR